MISHATDILISDDASAAVVDACCAGGTRSSDVIVAESLDEQLVVRALIGEAEAFAQLFHRYQAKTFRLAYGMTANAAHAEDLTQEIFIRAFNRLDTFKHQASFRTWFYRLAVNHCLNHTRRPMRETSLERSDEYTSTIAHRATTLDHQLMQTELQYLVQQALLTLPPPMRVLIVLKEIENLSYQEIAERLACSEGTVASGLNRARKLLARKLEALKGKI